MSLCLGDSKAPIYFFKLLKGEKFNFEVGYGHGLDLDLKSSLFENNNYSRIINKSKWGCPLTVKHISIPNYNSIKFCVITKYGLFKKIVFEINLKKFQKNTETFLTIVKLNIFNNMYILLFFNLF